LKGFLYSFADCLSKPSLERAKEIVNEVKRLAKL